MRTGGTVLEACVAGDGPSPGWLEIDRGQLTVEHCKCTMEDERESHYSTWISFNEHCDSKCPSSLDL